MSTERMKERFLMWLAWRMPRKLVYWCAIRLISHATVGRYSNQVVPELNALEALKRWIPALALKAAQSSREKCSRWAAPTTSP